MLIEAITGTQTTRCKTIAQAERIVGEYRAKHNGGYAYTQVRSK